MKKTTTFANGITITTFPAPPAAFDFERATDKERALYGLPRLASASSEVQKRWVETFRKVRFIEPEFEEREVRPRKLPSVKAGHGPRTTNIWSGVVATPAAGDKIWAVDGNWNLPRTLPPPGAKSGIWYTASTWIGIDGYGSDDVLQAGCDADVKLSGKKTENKLSPWWEWYPKGSFWIKNMDPQVGDEFTCMVQCAPLLFGEPNPDTASIFLADVTGGIGFAFLAKAPHHITLNGNCAEWIVEALETGPHDAPELASFTPVTFNTCAAYTVLNKAIFPDSGFDVDMVDSNNNVIAEGAAAGVSDVVVTFV